MTLLKKADRLLACAIRVGCAALLGLMVVVVFGQVIARYIFNAGFSWPEELTRFACVWITFLGALTATMGDSHPAVDVLVKAMPGMIQNLICIALRIVMIIVCLYLTNYGYVLTKMTIHDMSPGLHFPMGLVYLSLPLCTAVMVPYLAAQLVCAVLELFHRGDGREDK